MMLLVMEKGITMIMILIYFPEGGGLNRLQWFSYSQSFAASNKVFRSIFHSSAVSNPPTHENVVLVHVLHFFSRWD